MAIKLVFTSNAKEVAREVDTINKSAKKTQKSVASVDKSLNKINNNATKLNRSFRGLATAAAGVVASLGVGNLLKGVDEIGKAAKSIGLTTSEVQALSLEFQYAGQSMEQSIQTLMTFSRTASEASVGMGELASLSEQLGVNFGAIYRDGGLTGVIEALSDFSKTSSRGSGVAILSKIGGETAGKLLPAFQKLNKSLEELTKQRIADGLIIPPATVKAVEELNDAFTKLKTALTVEFVSSLTGALKAFVVVVDSGAYKIPLLVGGVLLLNKAMKVLVGVGAGLGKAFEKASYQIAKARPPRNFTVKARGEMTKLGALASRVGDKLNFWGVRGLSFAGALLKMVRLINPIVAGVSLIAFFWEDISKWAKNALISMRGISDLEGGASLGEREAKILEITERIVWLNEKLEKIDKGRGGASRGGNYRAELATLEARLKTEQKAVDAENTKLRWAEQYASTLDNTNRLLKVSLTETDLVADAMENVRVQIAAGSDHAKDLEAVLARLQERYSVLTGFSTNNMSSAFSDLSITTSVEQLVGSADYTTLEGFYSRARQLTLDQAAAAKMAGEEQLKAQMAVYKGVQDLSDSIEDVLQTELRGRISEFSGGFGESFMDGVRNGNLGESVGDYLLDSIQQSFATGIGDIMDGFLQQLFSGTGSEGNILSDIFAGPSSESREGAFGLGSALAGGGGLDPATVMAAAFDPASGALKTIDANPIGIMPKLDENGMAGKGELDKFVETNALLYKQPTAGEKGIMDGVSTLVDTNEGGFGGLGQMFGNLFGGGGMGTAMGAIGGIAALGSAFGLFDNGGKIQPNKFGIVGERGPELVSGPATVYNRAKTAREMAQAGASGGPTALNFNFQGDFDAQSERSVRRMVNSGMLQSALNGSEIENGGNQPIFRTP